MDFTHCAQCGTEIEGKGIQFRGRTFCGDECCEEFDAEVVAKGEPDVEELAVEDLADVDLDDEVLGELDLEDDGTAKKYDDEDDYGIDPDDF